MKPPEVDVTNMLRELDQEWYGGHRKQLGLPSLKRLWGLAVKEAQKRFDGRLSQEEVFSLFSEALLEAVPRFNPKCPPNEGDSRRGTEDRFVYFFAQNLHWKLEEERNFFRRRRSRPEQSQFRGPRGANLDSVPQPKSKTALCEAVRDAVAMLDKEGQYLINSRYWDRVTFEVMAEYLAYTNRFVASRQLGWVCDHLRTIFSARVKNKVVHAEDEWPVWAA